MAKDRKHDDYDKTLKRSSFSLSSDEDDAKHEVFVQESTHKCNVCGKTFSNGKALGGHRRSHSLKKKPNHHHHHHHHHHHPVKVETPFSTQGNSNSSSFVKDRNHDYEKTYVKSEKTMKRSYSSLSSDEDDAKDEVIVQESTHKCNVCGKTFSNGRALGGHRRSHNLKKKPNHHSEIKVETPFSIHGSGNNRASFDKDHKHYYENTYEESKKRIKSSSSSLSSDEDDVKDEVSILESTHMCNICGKTFSNGKALGGHRRSHFLKKETNHPSQKVKTLIEEIDDSEDEEEIDGIKKPTCYLCKKEFPTKNALYGHMRSHPNRVFKGLSPPSIKEEQDDGNFSLPKWQKRDKRGRKCIGSAAAALILLQLRSDKSFCVGKSSSNGNGRNELGGNSDSSDKQLKKEKGLLNLNEPYVMED